MKEPSKKSAFTLVELLAVVFVIALLGMMLLPHLATSGPGPLSQCVANQKQLSVGFLVWNNDHNGKFPWQISTTNGGTMESVASGQAAPQFKAQLSLWKADPNTKLPFKLFVCPLDKGKTVAKNDASISDANVSYFINVDAAANQTNTILTGDRLLEANGNPVSPGLFKYTKGDAVAWSPELHRGKGFLAKHGSSFGVLSFVDGHVLAVRSSDLTSLFGTQDSMTNHLIVP